MCKILPLTGQCQGFFGLGVGDGVVDEHAATSTEARNVARPVTNERPYRKDYVGAGRGPTVPALLSLLLARNTRTLLSGVDTPERAIA